jgi:hypothetical protein
MTAIMCTRTLQQVLVKAGEQWTGPRAEKTEPERRLGNWAATVVTDLTPPLVIATEERSSLTLLVRLTPVKSLRRRLADALLVALTARGVADDAAGAEAKRVQEASFTMFRNNPQLRKALEFAAFETASHVNERQDAESVQEMLEENPHTAVVPLTPSDVIRRLFDVPTPAEAILAPPGPPVPDSPGEQDGRDPGTSRGR